ncbi:uncharacterized protein Z518_09646 [Rhinocladiella mackenziei CBS 650.93]|uniref:Xylanolytic transcriptional activator regulatory domain-containing protein n=1 Tax=Rhinocladiella mackenziei CBS 650.93 TaxID=1442369 RepID=A0A0D2IBB3_9EURO|nr:uncharacterized protein Z518_09646 [Rhinocladiella mackenziei CBS 650.93]KIX00581.1 hypothetical protein Z518_09646 [Rhinocladiella mackenziei CBS 650.93]
MSSLVSNDLQPRQRMKYAKKACSECKRRKIRMILAVVAGRAEDLKQPLPRNFCSQQPWQHQNVPNAQLESPSFALGSLPYPSPQRQFYHAIEINDNDVPGDSLARSTLFLPFADDLEPGPNPDFPASTAPPAARKPSSTHVSSQLYPDQQLGITLKHCFDELELFYPCMDRSDFYERLSDLFIIHCTCQGRSTQIPLLAKHLSLAALTCILLAIGTYLGYGVSANDEQRSQGDDDCLQASMSWYAESTMLLTKFDWTEQPNTDVLRFHMLEVIYMTMLDKRGGVTKSLSIAVDLAYSLRVNNERTWSTCTIREQEYLRLLWWTLYYMDRRVALSFERPVLIRDTDFFVDEFRCTSARHYMENDEWHDRADNSSSIGLVWPMPSKPPEDFFHWLKFCVRWSKIVTRIWDTSFSLKATEAAALNAIEITDDLLMEAENDLPASLRWDATSLPCSILPGDMDRTYRLKVIVYEVRKRPLFPPFPDNSNAKNGPCQAITQGSRYERTVQMTETLASSAMDAIVTYLTLRNYARPWSTYASILLVQLSSRISPFVKSRNSLTDTSCRVIASINNAHFCMEELANARLSAAKRASSRLTLVLEELLLLCSTGIPELFTAPDTMLVHLSELRDQDSCSTTAINRSGIDFDDVSVDPFWENLLSTGGPMSKTIANLS